MADLKICVSLPMAERLGEEIAEIAPHADLATIDLDGTTTGDPSSADVFCFSLDLARQGATLGLALEQLQSARLRWVQSPGAGVELPIWSELMGRGVRLTSAAGIHAEPIAQYIFAYVLHWERRVDAHFRQQQERTWQVIQSDDLTTKTIGIVGFGGIGTSTARVAKAFGMRVLALRRGKSDDPNVDQLFEPSQLGELLRKSDFVVLSVPLTNATRHLIGRVELEMMGADTVLINVARGGVIDQDALVDALERRVIRGATLDVVEPEPLPPESRLWGLANCVITPHDAGYSPVADERLGRLFIENLVSFVADEPMRNEIHPNISI